MRPSEIIRLHRARIREIVLSHRVQDVRLFGSVARGEDTEHSDLDLLVLPTEQTTLMDIGAIRHELKQLLGIEVDVLTPGSLPLLPPAVLQPRHPIEHRPSFPRSMILLIRHEVPMPLELELLIPLRLRQ